MWFNKTGNILPTLPLTGSHSINLLKLLNENNVSGMRGYSRLVYTSLVQLFYSNLLWMNRNKKYQEHINQVKDKEIVFIIGHWRSGTTFLHRLLASNTQFSFLNNSAAFSFPSTSSPFAKYLQKVVALHLPTSRPMDWIPMDVNEPQEDEFVLMTKSIHSAYHGWNFPHKFNFYFQKYCLGIGLSARERAEQIEDYKCIVSEMAALNSSKILLLKNPCNTGRLDWLATEFPRAKFIYLHRNSEQTIQSTIHLHNTLIDKFGFSERNGTTIEEETRTMHRLIIDKYNADKKSINGDRVFEVDYEHLIASPETVIVEISNFLNMQYASFVNDRYDFLLKENKRVVRKVYKTPLAERFLESA